MAEADVVPEEMKNRIARFGDLQPSKKSFNPQTVGVPGEAYEMIAAHSVFSVMAPEGNTRGAAKPAVTGIPGLEVAIAVCPPGQGPALHSHDRTIESFLCVSGRFEVIWGDNAEHSVVLEQADFISVPPKVYRRFRNVSDVPDAKLLVLVQGGIKDTFGDVSFDPKLVPQINERFGEKVVENFKNIGIFFGKPGSSS